RGGIPSVICGPGSIAQAHKPDEYIAISELEKGGEFVTRLIDHACTAGSH
ncbi:MAG: M20/M25/M40 family metallo-hydrolase, partial [Alphaproteobacteria bacterium]